MQSNPIGMATARQISGALAKLGDELGQIGRSVAAAPCLSDERCRQRLDNMLSSGSIAGHYYVEAATTATGHTTQEFNEPAGEDSSISEPVNAMGAVSEKTS